MKAIYPLTIKIDNLTLRFFVDNKTTAEQVCGTFEGDRRCSVTFDPNGVSLLYTSAVDAISAIEEALIDAARKK